MSHLKSKSEFNLEAAKILIEDYDNYAPSVHCSYYGCFQFVKWKLNNLGYTYEMIDQAIDASRNDFTRLTTHGYPIDLICQEITKITQDSGIYARDIKDKIKLLRKYRVLSDYHNKIVDHNTSTVALALSHKIINLIKTKL